MVKKRKLIDEERRRLEERFKLETDSMNHIKGLQAARQALHKKHKLRKLEILKAEQESSAKLQEMASGLASHRSDKEKCEQEAVDLKLRLSRTMNALQQATSDLKSKENKIYKEQQEKEKICKEWAEEAVKMVDEKATTQRIIEEEVARHNKRFDTEEVEGSTLA